MTDIAPPPVYPDLDLRDFSYMPLDVVRLRDSEIAALSTGEEFRAAVMLWCASWHQVPASSLPADDRLLARLAGYGRDVDAWLAVKENAMRGFYVCSDGRLYHPVIAEKATEADNKRRSQRERTAKATAARQQYRDDTPDEQRDVQRDDARNVHQGKGREENRREGKKTEDRRSVADATRPAVDDDFERFWAEYPRREGSNPKEPARKLFKQACRAQGEAERLIRGASGYKRECDRLRITGTDKVAQAQTWLRQQRWGDYLGAVTDEPSPTHMEFMRSRGYSWIDGKWVQKPPDVSHETGDIGPIEIPALRRA